METEYEIFAREHGRSLAAAGVKSFGFERKPALAALAALRESGLAVLGGEVYSAGNGELRLTYDNWSTERRSAESFDDFQTRSLAAAEHYISNYRESEQAATLYALVECERS